MARAIRLHLGEEEEEEEEIVFTNIQDRACIFSQICAHASGARVKSV